MILEKVIQKYRIDMSEEDIKEQSDEWVKYENALISKYNNHEVCMLGLGKDQSFGEIVSNGNIQKFSFKGWEDYSRRLSYIEYLYCLRNDLVPIGWK